MPLYQVEVSKVLVARVYIDAEDEEAAAEIALQDPPDEEQFEHEDTSVGDISEVEDGEAYHFVHNGSRRGTRVSDWFDVADPEDDDGND